MDASVDATVERIERANLSRATCLMSACGAVKADDQLTFALVNGLEQRQSIADNCGGARLCPGSPDDLGSIGCASNN